MTVKNCVLGLFGPVCLRAGPIGLAPPVIDKLNAHVPRRGTMEGIEKGMRERKRDEGSYAPPDISICDDRVCSTSCIQAAAW